MTRIYDCFLYNDERELLSIRLQLLAHIVHKFVIVWSSETFTGIKKQSGTFPLDLIKSPDLEGRIELIELPALIGKSALEKQTFSRNALLRGIAEANSSDLIMLSDVDEIPRPSVLTDLARQPHRDYPIVLGQDYYNFKFNYKLMHGIWIVWAGPVLCRPQTFKSMQELRDKRWNLLESSKSCVEDAGWHFSYLTATEDVSNKLRSLFDQKNRIHSRGEKKISSLISTRQGFYDHLYPGSVWAVVALSSLGCPDLERLISKLPPLVVSDNADDSKAVDRAIRNFYLYERSKILSWFGWRKLLAELLKRLRRRISFVLRTH
ncbi:MAG TPA: hypothetical protein VJ180_08860 [Pyrinomonadaceae bacterium]|nr:hypothetical protein [Pyrinomonadaceae bacterium]